jgi:hypothetical protein
MASKPTTSSGETKNRIIITEKSKTSPIKVNSKIIKAFEIALTLFYGQFLANAIYDNFIYGIPALVEEVTAFPIIRVILGVLIILQTVYSMVAIRLRKWILLFPSAIILILISLFALIITVIDLTQREDKLDKKEFISAICEVVVETIFRIGAIVVKFFMIRILRNEYLKVPDSA